MMLVKTSRGLKLSNGLTVDVHPHLYVSVFFRFILI